jgi:hypothetical protein
MVQQLNEAIQIISGGIRPKHLFQPMANVIELIIYRTRFSPLILRLADAPLMTFETLLAVGTSL